MPLQNSLSLSIHPRLRRAAFRKAAEEGFTENKKKLKDRAKDRDERKVRRQELRGRSSEESAISEI